MNSLEFILGLVQALVWPMMVLILVLLFKSQIINLIKSIRTIRLGKLEAELERIREEAVATIGELRNLALSLSVPVAGILPGFIRNRDGTTTFRMSAANKRLEFANEIVKSLIELGVDASEAEVKIMDAMNEHIRLIHIGWINDIYNDIKNPNRINDLLISKESFPVIEQLKENKISIIDAKNILKSDVEKILEEPNNLSIELFERLEDLDYFDKNKKLRRPREEPWG